MKKAKLEIERLLASNPQVDGTELEKGLNLLRELEKTGVVKPHTYSIAVQESLYVFRGE